MPAGLTSDAHAPPNAMAPGTEVPQPLLLRVDFCTDRWARRVKGMSSLPLMSTGCRIGSCFPTSLVCSSSPISASAHMVMGVFLGLEW